MMEDPLPEKATKIRSQTAGFDMKQLAKGEKLLRSTCATSANCHTHTHPLPLSHTPAHAPPRAPKSTHRLECPPPRVDEC